MNIYRTFYDIDKNEIVKLLDFGYRFNKSKPPNRAAAVKAPALSCGSELNARDHRIDFLYPPRRS